MLAPDRWARVRAVLEEAVARQDDDRREYLAEACRCEPDIQREIESLLAAHAAASGFLEPDDAVVRDALRAVSEAAPALQPGIRLGPFEIVAPLGAGGMGHVYRARDTRLDREVALKFLSPHLASDARHQARFELEARAISRLTHLHICVLHDVGRADTGDGVERQFLVMELVDGETLHARLARGPLPIDQALTSAIEIAEALAAAHAEGIVHCDLKPANIMLTKTGVKLLDFGLARLGGADGAGSASTDRNEIGVIAGTLPYMAPEQVRGEGADTRADIFALGAVLYEMVSGRRAFAADSRSELIAAILERDPPRLVDKGPHFPPAIDRLVRTCLAKDPARRWQHPYDVALELRAIEEREEEREGDVLPHPGRRRPAWRWLAAAAGLMVVAAAVRFMWPVAIAPPAQGPVMQFDVDLGPDVSMGSRHGGPAVAISPNGERLVFESNGRLITRRLDQPLSVPLMGTEGVSRSDGLSFFFSPDSEALAFVADRKLKRVALDGGSAVTICDVPLETRGGAWGEDDSIVFARMFDGLMRVHAGGGRAEPLTRLDTGEITHRWPQILPGGKAVLFTSHAAPTWWSRARIEVLSLADNRRIRLQERATFGRFVTDAEGDGYLTFVRGGTLFAAAFDPVRLELLSTPIPVLEHVAYDNGGAAQVDGSRTGTVVTRREALFNVAWLDSAGGRPLFREAGNYHGPAVSRDGNRIAYSAGEDVWVYDLRREMRTRVTKGYTAAGSKAWSPDDQFIVFSTPEGIWYVRSDGGSEPRLLLPAQAPSWRVATSITGDRHSGRLAFHEFTIGGRGMWDQWTIPVRIDGAQMRAGKPEPFLQTKDDERHLDFSPDGRWVAYISREEGGRHETYVRGFPDDGRRWKVSDGVGFEPRWSPGRPELFFQAEELLMMAPYSVQAAIFVPGKPRVWSRQPLPLLMQRGGPVYSLSPDGRRVVAIIADQSSEEHSRRLTVWVNAVTEFRRRMPSRE